MTEGEYRTVKSQATVLYEPAPGPVWTRFFEGLKEEKILATKCKRCGRVLVPARPFCPRCFEDMEEWVEVGPEGILGPWCYVNYTYFGLGKELPYVIGEVKLDGADRGLRHFIGGFDPSDIDKVTELLKHGIRVKAVWRKEKQGHILDIDYFEPVK